MKKPERLSAEIIFDGHPDQETYGVGGLEGLTERIRSCIETHPTLSFRIAKVSISRREFDALPRDKSSAEMVDAVVQAIELPEAEE